MRDAALEQRQMLGTADARNQQMHVVNLVRIDLGERARQEVGLLLVVAFERDAVAGLDQGFERIDDAVGWQDAVFEPGRNGREATVLLVAARGP